MYSIVLSAAFHLSKAVSVGNGKAGAGHTCNLSQKKGQSSVVTVVFDCIPCVMNSALYRRLSTLLGHLIDGLPINHRNGRSGHETVRVAFPGTILI